MKYKFFIFGLTTNEDLSLGTSNIKWKLKLKTGLTWNAFSSRVYISYEKKMSSHQKLKPFITQEKKA